MMTAEDRAAFRAWVRAHHPDVGGDPAEFAAGLRRMRAAAARSRGRAPVEVVRIGRGPLARLTRWRERRRRARRLL
ncbi:hypothetical protein [Actinomadura rugatobispora]|uniref:J domain-containing protein n=1 Tax=Actinomadura rugatobispora TaxID=1994 RepID=A0ABW0ZSP7_9ACTN|nr:hypothetical protein GCM10010200_028770 [Actinomadura rugatobispora]